MENKYGHIKKKKRKWHSKSEQIFAVESEICLTFFCLIASAWTPYAIISCPWTGIYTIDSSGFQAFVTQSELHQQ